MAKSKFVRCFQTSYMNVTSPRPSPPVGKTKIMKSDHANLFHSFGILAYSWILTTDGVGCGLTSKINTYWSLETSAKVILE